ncbi:TIGR04283 family arsenosugar biosynthesis glycosyltransferase [Rhodohalobacter barkolensis]|uniref:Glycosyltransferase 2-like domain-containing protein n=1 Tax=Rhodohalobacter barkolensis TaxID=2053187 RepID=A0A2N0VG63_9BACT|nr:TIGR04283 family arsenosugar biosynthesis glycosyltransferase [Rhodohalobacter barkolensis]PKD43173.1 hypothetical protein CWD77_11140 [Rhodohalobacter barkolensis]
MNEEAISIIIPVLNEEGQIKELINNVQKLQYDDGNEIIVVDGGSSDRTAELAKRAGAKVVVADKGRAKQMNAGARAARGDVLYFLHADTTPPKLFDREILKAIQKGYGFGCFRLVFDWDHPILRFYSYFTRFRLTEIRFGDQSLFVQKKLFEKAGGFDEDLIVMEDQKIVRDLKRIGSFYLSERNVITSARKYRNVGVIRLQLIFTFVWLGYYAGLSQEVLFHFYKNQISS